MSLNTRKYENAILYMLHHANNEHLGKVKLMKLLYYLDFDHFEKYGRSVTGDSYRKLEYGPVPMRGDMTLNQMAKEGLIKIITVPAGVFCQYRYVPLQESDASVFSASEMEMLAEVACKWEHHSRSEIVSATHGEAPWRGVRMGAQIPYELAYYRRKYVVDDSDEDEIPDGALAMRREA